MASNAIFPTAEPRTRAGFVAIYWPELLALLVLIEVIAAATAADRFHLGGQIPWTDYYLLWLVPAGGVFIGLFLIWLWKLYRSGEERPAWAMAHALRTFGTRNYIEFFVPIVVMAPFMASYTTFKVLLADIHHGTADPWLARLDGIFGFQPWQLSHALIGPTGTVALDRLYSAWFIVNHVMLMAVLFVPRLARLRSQVLLSFVLAWIVLGTMMAVLFPSVGPCYYGQLYRPDIYADLMARLNEVGQSHGLVAIEVQKKLWVEHSREVLGLGSGISAMPSMHVSIATITALLLRRLGFAWLGWMWLAAIWIGSFHLGWHYASDGLVSIIGTVAIWALCSRLLKRESGSSNPLAAPESSRSSRANAIG